MNILIMNKSSEIKVTVLVSQVLASLVIINLCAGFPGLYAMLVCAACSQLEKLRWDLLDIRRAVAKSQQNCLAAAEQQQEQGQRQCSEELLRDMQQQLNGCIRHHQEIKRCDHSK